MFMGVHQTLFKTFVIKSCCITIGALLLSACAQKFNDTPNIRVLKTCPSPIATYHLVDIKSGDYNDLTLANANVQQMVEKSLTQSGCFQSSPQTEENNTDYQLEVIFGNINTQNQQRGFWYSQTSDQAIFEVQLNFSKPNEMKIFRGKSSIQNQNSQYLVVFGDDSKLNPNQIQITLQNAVNSAVNEAVRIFTQDQNGNPTNPYNF